MKITRKVLVLVSLTLFISIFTACGAKTQESISQDQDSPSAVSTNSNLTTKQMTSFDQTSLPVTGEKIAILTTNFGEIKIRLFLSQAPETVKNFIELTNQGKYENVIFHRVVPGFVIQGGDFEKGNGTGGYSYKGPGTEIKNEIDPELSHIRGAVSMANAGPDTNGSQFFIVLPETRATMLDGDYSIFGQVYEGMDAVDDIAKVKTDSSDTPLDKVVIEKVEIKDAE